MLLQSHSLVTSVFVTALCRFKPSAAACQQRYAQMLGWPKAADNKEVAFPVFKPERLHAVFSINSRPVWQKPRCICAAKRCSSSCGQLEGSIPVLQASHNAGHLHQHMFCVAAGHGKLSRHASRPCMALLSQAATYRCTIRVTTGNKMHSTCAACAWTAAVV